MKIARSAPTKLLAKSSQDLAFRKFYPLRRSGGTALLYLCREQSDPVLPSLGIELADPEVEPLSTSSSPLLPNVFIHSMYNVFVFGFFYASYGAVFDNASLSIREWDEVNVTFMNPHLRSSGCVSSSVVAHGLICVHLYL